MLDDPDETSPGPKIDWDEEAKQAAYQPEQYDGEHTTEGIEEALERL